MAIELLLGGRIYSPSSPDATAMAIADGTVVWIGADQPGRALHPDAKITHLDGAFVAPAFVDAHVHLTATGLAHTALDLSGVTSLQGCLDALRAHASGHDEPLIWGQGWDDSAWPEQRPPEAAELDAAGGGRPVYLSRVDVHSAVCSSALLAAVSGIERERGFESTGRVTGDAHHRARRYALDALSPSQRAKARLHALDEAAAAGIAAVHECGGPNITGHIDFRELGDTDHGVEVRRYWGEAVSSAEQAEQLLAETEADGLGGDLFVDGALGSRTAWLREPYTDRPDAGCGNSYLDVDSISDHLSACTRAKVQAGFHVIGDAAVTAVVHALRRVVAELGGPAVAACGHRLEHVEMVDSDYLDELAGWGVIASVQPVFDAEWGGADGMYAHRVGRDRAARMNPFAALASAGVSLALGSDTPVTSPRPWAAVRAAVAHNTSGFGISPRAAFAAATRGAWRAGGVRDGVAGTLVPGAPASYAVWETGELVVAAASDSVRRWSTDPRSRVPGLPRLDPDAAEPTCLRTVHRGVTIHER